MGERERVREKEVFDSIGILEGIYVHERSGSWAVEGQCLRSRWRCRVRGTLADTRNKNLNIGVAAMRGIERSLVEIRYDSDAKSHLGSWVNAWLMEMSSWLINVKFFV